MEANTCKRLLVLVMVAWGMLASAAAQPYDPLHPPNSYRSPHNPHYWKNKLPFPGYWQQDVHYTIDAVLDDSAETITASETLIYWNNSPDTLTFVFFHLYQNAFHPASYYHALHQLNKQTPRFGRYEAQGLGTIIEHLTVEGRQVDTFMDNTIMKVSLPRPLLPGDSIRFDIRFTTYFDRGSIRRRMKVFDHDGVKHFDAVHWYPRIDVYDRKFGWTPDQHLGREFYGDFGTYDVSITLPSHYVLDATGFLLNRDEVLPPELRKKLDISNFKDKPWGSPPSQIIPIDGTTKTWRFHAENVHDFAFTTDPTYRIGEAEWNGIRAVALVQEPHAGAWQQVPKYTARVIELFSRDFGPYIYHKIIVADARDGMEYPMLTLCGGAWPSNAYLIAHEVGHNWFFGMMGSNETYRALLDEGFTQFLTAWALDRLRGPSRYGLPRSRWLRKYYPARSSRFTVAYLGYLRDAIRKQDPVLATHSDHFNDALRHGGGYRHVYSKTATMLYNLRYVLGGDSLFLGAMRLYYDRWHAAHPYVEDFKQAMRDHTKLDLNWFFDAWIHGKKYIDYRVGRIRKKRLADSVQYRIDLVRKESLSMPLEVDVRVRTAGGDSTVKVFVPNHYVYVPREDRLTMRPWIGWNRLKRHYTLALTLPRGAAVRSVEIDPSATIADINMVDNRRPRRMAVMPDVGEPVRPLWTRYEVFTRPDVWYNAVDGVQVGWHARGSYFGYLHRFHLSAWYHTQLLDFDTSGGGMPFSVIFRYETPIRRGDVEARLKLQYRRTAGVKWHSTAFDFDLGRNHYLTVAVDYQAADSPNVYALIPDGWSAGRHIFSRMTYRKHWKYFSGGGRLQISLRGGLSGRYYGVATAEYQEHRRLPGGMTWRSRLFGYTAAGDVPAQAMLYVAGGGPEDMLSNKYYRAVGFFPSAWRGYGAVTGPLYYPGGLNLRGYAGYVLPHDTGAAQTWNYRTRRGVSYSAQVSLPRMLQWRNRFFDFLPYVFADVGTYTVAQGGAQRWVMPRSDAGPGFDFRWKYGWRPYLFNVSVDFPVFLSHVPYAEPGHWAFRYRLSVAARLWR